MTRHARQIQTVLKNSKQLKTKKIVKHSIKVTAGAGMWFVSTFFAHDPIVMVVLLVISITAQTIAEEFIED